MLLRNPFLRLASTYLDKIVNPNFDPAKVKINLLKKYTNVGPNELTFRKFVSLISLNNTLRFDIHWRPQVDFLVYHNYDLYVQMEKFENSKTLIEKNCNVKIIDARKLTLHGNDIFKKIKDKNFTNIAPFEILNLRTKGASPSLVSMYDEETKKIVCDLFKEDIILYDSNFNEKC